MLDKFRGFADTIAAKILMGLIALSFLSWGITGYILNGGQNPTVASVGGTDVSLAQFQNEYRRQILQMERMVGKNLNLSADMKNALVSQVLENMKYRMLMDAKAKELGFVMTDDAVFEVIKQQNEFKDEKGNFSYNIYNQVMVSNNIAEKMFYKEIESQNGRFILTTLLQTGIAVPLMYVNFAYDFAYQERNIKYVSVDASLIKIEGIGEDELKTVYEQNKHNYATPEFRQIEYVFIERGNNADEVLKKAEEVENEVIGGMAFNQVATKFGVKYGKLPFITAGMISENGTIINDSIVSKELVKSAYEVGVKQETSIIGHNGGYIILYTANVKPAGFLSFDMVKNKIMAIAIVSEQNKLAYVKANELLNDAVSGKNLSFKTMQIGRNDKNVDDQLISKVFTSPKGEWFVAKNNNGYVVGMVSGIKNGEKNNAEMMKVAELLKKQMPDLIMQDYMKYLEHEMGVKTYPQKILNTVE